MSNLHLYGTPPGSYLVATRLGPTPDPHDDDRRPAGRAALSDIDWP